MKNKAQTIRLIFYPFMAAVLLSAIFQVIYARAESTAPARAKIEERNDRSVSTKLESIADDLEKKRQELDQREQALAEQERNLKDREADLEKKIKELKTLRTAFEASIESHRKGNEERVARMVTVFESMQPKAAAQVFETLDDWLSVEVLKRMDTKKVAKLMNLMNKNRSAKLSELLTGFFKENIDKEKSAVANK